MSKYIDADELIKWTRETQHQTTKMKNVICKIESMPTIDIPTWIPCSERLPAEDVAVLVQAKHYDPHITELVGDWGEDDNGEDIWCVWFEGLEDYDLSDIVWMPLPPPYKVGEREGE